MIPTVYYVWCTNTPDDNDSWEVHGVYTKEEYAEAHKISLLLDDLFEKVVVISGPLEIN